MPNPLTLLTRLLPQSQTPPPTTTAWQRVDPSPSTKLPHPKPTFKINQRVYAKAHYDAHSSLQQQSYWIKGWRWDQIYAQMTYLLAYTPNGLAYGCEVEGGLVAV